EADCGERTGREPFARVQRAANRPIRTTVRKSSRSATLVETAPASQDEGGCSAISVHKASGSLSCSAITEHCKKNRIQVKHYLINFWQKLKKMQNGRKSRARAAGQGVTLGLRQPRGSVDH